ncbi:unnamed protein product, partial [Discosporangium mesarthrocarpum]
VFLAVYLKDHPTEEEAVLVSIGEKSFTVLVVALGLNSRVYLDKIPDINAQFDGTAKALELQATSETTHSSWKRVVLKIFSRIIVRCTAKRVAPIDVQVDFVRPLAGGPPTSCG